MTIGNRERCECSNQSASTLQTIRTYNVIDHCYAEDAVDNDVAAITISLPEDSSAQMYQSSCLKLQCQGLDVELVAWLFGSFASFLSWKYVLDWFVDFLAGTLQKNSRPCT